MSLIHLDGSGSVAPVQFTPPQVADLNYSVIVCLILLALAAGLLLSGGKRKG